MSINHDPISKQSSLKYLGVILDEKLDWKPQIEKLVTQLSKSEMIAIWFTGWISGRIVSLQPETHIQNCLRRGTGYESGYPKRFFRYFDDSDFGKSCTLHNHTFFIIFRSIFSAFCATAMSPRLVCLWCNLCTVV